MKEKRTKDITRVVQLAIEGNQNAFDKLLQQIGRLVLYHCVKHMGNQADGEDAAQEVFILIHKNIQSLKSAEAFNVWMYRLINHTCIRLKSGRKNAAANANVSLEEVVDTMAETKTDMLPDTYLQNADKQQQLLEIVNGLPDTMRDCVLLYYYDGMPVKDIAKVLFQSENSINVTLHRARLKIRTELLKNDPNAYATALVPFAALSEALKIDAAHIASNAAVKSCLATAGFGKSGMIAAKPLFASIKPLALAAMGTAVIVGGAFVASSLPWQRGDPQHPLSGSTVENMSITDAQSPAPAAASDVPLQGSTGTYVITGIIYLDNPTTPKGSTWEPVVGATVQLYSADGTQAISEPIPADSPMGFRLSTDIEGHFRVMITLPNGALFAPEQSTFLTPFNDSPQKAWLSSQGNEVFTLSQKNPTATGLRAIAYYPAQLTGRVACTSSHSLSGITIDLTHPDGTSIATTVTASDGSYVFDNPTIARAGNYLLSIRPPLPGQLATGEQQIVSLVPGQSVELPVLTVIALDH